MSGIIYLSSLLCIEYVTTIALTVKLKCDNFCNFINDGSNNHSIDSNHNNDVLEKTFKQFL